ncbi:MAG: histidine--tRNA ligase [Candidatus Gracilibacteria bacterium]
MNVKAPETCKGMRDFFPDQVSKRQYMFQVIAKHFQRYGFVQLETPTMENLSTLTGKYGDEGDQLIFKVLASGDYLKDYKTELEKAGKSEVSIQDLDSKQLLSKISDKALRYDLTIPFARFMAKNYRELPLPFKRYQMQPVWRADRPQKGRYREFYQCDADIIGSKSMLSEVDLLCIYDGVFTELGLPVTMKINNRKILTGIAETLQITDKLVAMTVAIDKLDKIGKEAVLVEMKSSGIPDTACGKIGELIDAMSTDYAAKLAFIKNLLSDSEIGRQGIEEIEYIFSFLNKLSFKAELELDLTLARGISYYTGPIFEVKTKLGSLTSTIAAGGRYDNLTGIFGVDGLAGVGISFGVERIYDLLEELDLFPKDTIKTVDIMLLNFGDREVERIYPYIQEIRGAGTSVEIYPENAKLKKQMQFASDKKTKYVLFAGGEELDKKSVQLKNMITGEQIDISLENLSNKISTLFH